MAETASEVPFVGLTGGLGAGKSTALAALERLGAAVVSTDDVVHELYRSDEVKRAVVDRWGPEMVVDGEVSRGAIASHVFADSDERAWLEGLYDATVAVIAPEEVRAERASGRGHAAVDERAARQLPQEEKARRATYTVINDGSVEELQAKLSDVLEKLSTHR